MMPAPKYWAAAVFYPPPPTAAGSHPLEGTDLQKGDGRGTVEKRTVRARARGTSAFRAPDAVCMQHGIGGGGGARHRGGGVLMPSACSTASGGGGWCRRTSPGPGAPCPVRPLPNAAQSRRPPGAWPPHRGLAQGDAAPPRPLCPTSTSPSRRPYHHEIVHLLPHETCLVTGLLKAAGRRRQRRTAAEKAMGCGNRRPHARGGGGVCRRRQQHARHVRSQCEWRTDRHQPPTTNRRQPPAATNRQLPTAANCHQLPPIPSCQLPTANRRQPPPAMVEHRRGDHGGLALQDKYLPAVGDSRRRTRYSVPSARSTEWGITEMPRTEGKCPVARDGSYFYGGTPLRPWGGGGVVVVHPLSHAIAFV